MLSTSKTIPPGGVHIVNLSSPGHYSASKGGINFSDLSLKTADPVIRYAQCKLANVLHTKSLHALYGSNSPSSKAGRGEIWSTAVHPGLVDTWLGTKSQLLSWLKVAASVIGFAVGRMELDKRSWTGVCCAASPGLKREMSGMYFQRIAELGWQSGTAKDPELAKKLEDWTIDEMKNEGWVD